MKVNAKWKETKTPVNETEQPVKIIRSDTRTILAECYGDAVTTLAVTVTVQKLLIDGMKVDVYTKTSGTVGDGIAITEVSADKFYKVVIPIIDKTDTSGFDPGDVFFFDVEFTTATERSTILGNFTLVEDRTLN
jgi:hypothetical protein